MKFVKISLFLLSAGFITANAEVDPLQKYANAKNILNAKCIGTIEPKTKSNKISAINFVAFDSMANSLSYMNDQTQPFIYEPGTGTLITIKRGSHEVTKPDFNRSNSKNNLFLRTSKDWGKTWDPTFLLYDKAEWGYGEVRFPSAAAYKDKKNNLMLAYTFALIEESASTWKGFATGFYGDLDQDGFIQSASLPSTDFTFKDAELDGTYAWGQLSYNASGVPNVAGTDSKIIAFDDNGLNLLATGIVTPLPEGNVNDNNNIAFRHTTPTLFNGNEISTGIPPAWNSKRFGVVDTVTTRSNNQVGLERTNDGKIYFAAFGNFETTGADTRRNEVGVSTSNDNGKTWSEFEIFPFQKIRDYVSGIEGHPSALNPELFFIAFTSKSFVALDNGDWSFFVILQETKDTVNAKMSGDLLYQIVELYKEGGNFGVRKVTDVPTTWVPFSNSDGTQAGNAKDYELQAAKTVDGNKIICKWVEADVTWSTDSTFQFAGSDIFAAGRVIGTNRWGSKKNLTNDGVVYKGVWIPNLLPNDLLDIPVIYSQTKGDLANTNQRRYLDEQYVVVGHFDGSDLTSVEDEQIASGDVSVYPNPAVDNATVRFYVPNMENVEIKIVDIFGKEISTSIVNSLVGFNNFEIDTKKFSPGAYFVSIKGSNIAKFEKFNVVK